MAKLLTLKTIIEASGELTVIEKILPFEIKRVFFITGASGERGGHKHKITYHALICLHGSIEAKVDNKSYILSDKNQCLIIEPQEWRVMKNFSPKAILLVLSSEYYNPSDYIYAK